jgi:hypothetical protein
MTYWPPRRGWEARPPADLGLDADALAGAVAFHESHESKWARDFVTESGRFIGVADEPPTSEVLGPIRPRGGPNGLVIRHGYIAAEWGDTRRADMSFSIAKSYLAVLAGVAVARGLIGSLDERVGETVRDGGFDSSQNRPITWRHLLTQTSEWQGTLWDKPDSIDHNRDVGKSELGHSDKGVPRPYRAPGTYWEYNDVRVNRLSLALLRVFRRPLPDVLGEAVMDPIGRTPTPGSTSTASACRRCPAARTGAAGSGCRAATTPASPSPCIAAAAGETSRSCRSRGRARCGRRARSIRSTVCCGGSIPDAGCFRARRLRATPLAAPAAT